MALEWKKFLRYRGVFITGTDTGIGKTYVGASLARELREEGIDTGVMKPIETGCLRRNGRLYPADGTALKRAAQVQDPIEKIVPIRLQKPLAPSVAARIERRRIDLQKIDRAYKGLLQKHDFLIVEGAGGALVPIKQSFYMIDLAKRLRLPILLVIGNRLGAINHALLTEEGIQRRGVPLLGWILNDCQSATEASETNLLALQRSMSAPYLGKLDFSPSPSSSPQKGKGEKRCKLPFKESTRRTRWASA